MEHKVSITCPICKKTHDFPRVSIVDWSQDESVKQKFEDGSLFECVCPECHFWAKLNYSYMYQDADIREYIYYSAEQAETALQKDQIARNAMAMAQGKTNDGLLRICYSEKDLKEKIAIFENGRDDRIVEVCKALKAQEYPFTEELFVTDIRYMNIGGQEVLRIILSDGGEEYATDFDEAYTRMEVEFGPMLPPMRGNQFICVDQTYISGLLREIIEGNM